MGPLRKQGNNIWTSNIDKTEWITFLKISRKFAEIGPEFPFLPLFRGRKLETGKEREGSKMMEMDGFESGPGAAEGGPEKIIIARRA